MLSVVVSGGAVGYCGCWLPSLSLLLWLSFVVVVIGVGEGNAVGCLVFLTAKAISCCSRTAFYTLEVTVGSAS